MIIQFEGKAVNIELNGTSYGIENLKAISGEIVAVWQKFKNRSENGLSFWEKVRTGIDVGNVGGDIVQKLGSLKHEILDLSPEEMRALAVHITELFGVPYTDALVIITDIVVKTLEIILAGVDVYKNIKELL
jgi:hypothetical protein